LLFVPSLAKGFAAIFLVQKNQEARREAKALASEGGRYTGERRTGERRGQR
jgi:hypothetical protein